MIVARSTVADGASRCSSCGLPWLASSPRRAASAAVSFRPFTPSMRGPSLRQRDWEDFDYAAVIVSQLPLARARPLELPPLPDARVQIRVMIDESAESMRSTSDP